MCTGSARIFYVCTFDVWSLGSACCLCTLLSCVVQVPLSLFSVSLPRPRPAHFTVFRVCLLKLLKDLAVVKFTPYVYLLGDSRKASSSHYLTCACTPAAIVVFMKLCLCCDGLLCAHLCVPYRLCCYSTRNKCPLGRHAVLARICGGKVVCFGAILQDFDD